VFLYIKKNSESASGKWNLHYISAVIFMGDKSHYCIKVRRYFYICYNLAHNCGEENDSREQFVFDCCIVVSFFWTIMLAIRSRNNDFIHHPLFTNFLILKNPTYTYVGADIVDFTPRKKKFNESVIDQATSITVER